MRSPPAAPFTADSSLGTRSSPLRRRLLSPTFRESKPLRPVLAPVAGHPPSPVPAPCTTPGRAESFGKNRAIRASLRPAPRQQTLLLRFGFKRFVSGQRLLHLPLSRIRAAPPIPALRPGRFRKPPSPCRCPVLAVKAFAVRVLLHRPVYGAMIDEFGRGMVQSSFGSMLKSAH